MRSKCQLLLESPHLQKQHKDEIVKKKECMVHFIDLHQFDRGFIGVCLLENSL